MAEPAQLPTAASSARAQYVLRMQAERGNAYVQRIVDGLTRAPVGVQRQPDDAGGGGGGAAGPAPSDGLIVEDSTEEPGPGQMKKSDFLAQARAQVNAAVDQALSGSAFAEIARPQIDGEIEQNYATYAGQSAEQLEQTLRAEVPGAAAAATANGFISALCTEVRSQIADQLPPPDVASQLAAAGGAALDAVADVGSSLVQGAGNLASAIFGKFRHGSATAERTAASPETIQRQLGDGTALDGRLATQFGEAMGTDFSAVRVHTDGAAAAASDQLDARAFTIGRDVAFGHGEYQPGTLIGDALIAHELAHVAQQSGGVSRSSGQGSDEASFEEGADLAAVGAIARMWGGVKDVSTIMAGNVLPGVRSGLRLQRCSRGRSAAPPAPVAAPTHGGSDEIPFDHSPLSSPGEQILFNDEYQHATPALFKLQYTAVGGKFDSATGAATKSVPGLISGNVPFFIDAAWDGVSPVNVQLDIVLVSDSSVKYTTRWTFGKKVNIPTAITQTESEATEFPNPASYTYTIGPHVGAPGTDSYLHDTILETFGATTSSLTMADMTDPFKTAHPGITTDAQLTDFFFGGSGSNGTFTVSAGDLIGDQHGGMLNVDDAVLSNGLKAPKEIWADLEQTYSAQPGTVLGHFTIRRIRKANGTMFVRKSKQP